MASHISALPLTWTWVGTAHLLLLGGLAVVQADEPTDLRQVVPDILAKEDRDAARRMIDQDIRRRTDEVNARNRTHWSLIQTRDQWEKYRDERIARLRDSLGEFPAPGKLNPRTTGVVDGDGFRIENLVYESRPGQWVPGNLYVPTPTRASMPGILIAHAHHRDKPQAELQDMGMTWARAGCLVLVIDQVGYGERRSHPFDGPGDFPKPYPVTRQDYFFRYDTGVQLQLLGDSLMAWMCWDLMRGVDLLLGRQGIDPKRIILLGAVAGGGDPAAVTAALDPRIACCVPFNFGGPQPESPYPLPADAVTRFDYLGGSYWDSTRGLRLGGRDDFLHWVIVASMAPRHLIHAHEFSWDGDRDPVWKRYQKIWDTFYVAADKLGYAHGHGLLKQSPSEASHCTNIGKEHRRMIHPLFKKWFDIRVTESDEYSAPRKREELLCLTPSVRKELKPKSLTQLMSGLGNERVARAREQMGRMAPTERREWLRRKWQALLGPVTPAQEPLVRSRSIDDRSIGGAKVERVVLEVEPGIVVPVLIFAPVQPAGRMPAVVGLAQAGKAGFLQQRAPEIGQMVRGGAMVVLPDLRGIGESGSGSASGPNSMDTHWSVHVQLFGETLVGSRLRDLHSVLSYLRRRDDLDANRLALWGDSFAPPNSPTANFNVPRGVEGWPQGPEPLGGLFGLLGALFENVRAVSISGGLASYHSVLGHFAVLIPHGVSVPGALTAGDLCDLAAGLAPLPLRLEAMVDHLNRPLAVDRIRELYAPALHSYRQTPEALRFVAERTSAVEWVLEQLK
jgi:dienelactone hydrolase